MNPDPDVDRLIACVLLLLDRDDPGVVEEMKLLLPLIARSLPKRHALARALRDPASRLGNRSDEVRELLVMNLIEEGNRLKSEASEQKEQKEGTWNYAVAGCIGGGFAATVAIATGALATPFMPAAFLVLAAAGWGGRRRAHRLFQDATDTAAALDALQGDLTRRL